MTSVNGSVIFEIKSSKVQVTGTKM